MKAPPPDPQGMFRHYIKTLFQNEGMKAWLSLALIVFLGLTQGVGLVMLVPFLGLIGLGGGANPDGISAHIGHMFDRLGVPLNLVSILCLYMGIVTIHAFLTRYREVLNTKIMEGFTQSLRNRVYHAVCRAEWLSFLHTKASDVSQVLTSDLQRVGFATQQFLQLTGSVIIALVHIVVSLMISIPMTLFALACGGGFLLALRPLNRRAQEVGSAFRGAMNDLYSAVAEHLGGMKVAKSFSLEEAHEKNFRRITNDVTDMMVRFTRVNAGTRMTYEIGAAAALAVFFWIAVTMVKMPAASLLLIVFLFARLLPRFSTIQQCVQRIANALPSFEAVLSMEKRFEAAEEPVLAGAATCVELNGEIHFFQVSFRYARNSETWVLWQVNAIIPARKITAIVGPSGAGKSTLADLILGLVSPEQGTVSIDGRALSGGLLQQWRRSVGYVPQDTFLFHDTIRANLLWALSSATDDDLWSVLEMAAAKEFVSRLPEGLNTVVGDRGIRLSGGERQRIALARALLRRPSLLLLDEATSSLDSENERRIQEAINALHGDLTIVVIAHRSSTLLMADATLVLDRGRVVEEDTKHTLTAIPGGRFDAMTGPRKP